MKPDLLPEVPPLPSFKVLDRYESSPPGWIDKLRTFPADDKAQELVYSSFETDDEKKKFRLCEDALKIFPFNVGAFNAIGHIYLRASMHQKALLSFERALACAKMLWPEIDQAEEIEWGYIEHRPYLRAVHGLAVAKCGREGGGDKSIVSEGIEHLRYLLKVCPRDNMGCRLILFRQLLCEGDYKEAEMVVEKHEHGRETSDCTFCWGFVLIDYLKFKLGVLSQENLETTLVRALQSNSHVAKLLIHDEVRDDSHSSISSGSLEQAENYVFFGGNKAWKRAAGALSWLRTICTRSGPKPDDYGQTLFNLLTTGMVMVAVENECCFIDYMIVTTRVNTIPGTGLPEFSLPPGMKEHDPERIVCYNCSAEWPGRFVSFNYESVREVMFWNVLDSCKVYKDDEFERKSCSHCYEPAKSLCSICHVAAYCSRSCQKKDWKEGHKMQCPKLVKR